MHMSNSRKLKKYTITLREDSVKIVEDFAKMYGTSPDEIIQDCLDERLGEIDENGRDPLFEDVLTEILQQDTITASFLQRKFIIGFNRSSRILKQLEDAGYITKSEGSKPRKVIKGN